MLASVFTLLLFVVIGVVGVFVRSPIAKLFLKKVEADYEEEAREQARENKVIENRARWISFGIGIVFFIVAIAYFLSLSVVWPKAKEFAVAKRTIGGGPLAPGKIVADKGENGPQAKIYRSGFNLVPFGHLYMDFEMEPIYSVPQGQCATMSAKDGEYIPNGGAFAEPWPDKTKREMINDAAFFLANGGQRGQQSTVLQPGDYTLNPYLWEKPREIPATRVEQGYVGVVKSSVWAAANFGSFQYPKPEIDERTNKYMEHKTEAGVDITTKLKNRVLLQEGAVAVNIVPVGGIGVWNRPLLPNYYYVNTEAYKVTMVPVSAMVFEFKGGYDKRSIDVTIDDQTGMITQKEKEVEKIPVPPGAEPAVTVKPEGWEVPLELRVLAQIHPDDAPLIVAAFGLTGGEEQDVYKKIDTRVVSPVIRSVVRDVCGGKSIMIRTKVPVLDQNGEPTFDENGEAVFVEKEMFRPVQVLDLINNREALEKTCLELAQAEAIKENVSIIEVRFGEAAIPPELMTARKREQLAQQNEKSWREEELAQQTRIKLEKTKAEAVKQEELVEAEIKLKAAKDKAEALKVEAEGEKEAILARAEGQKAQKEVLGESATVMLRIYETTLKTFVEMSDKNPDVLLKGMEMLNKNASRLVPSVYVNNGGGNGISFEGVAAVLGSFMSNQDLGSPTTGTTPATDTSESQKQTPFQQ